MQWKTTCHNECHNLAAAMHGRKKGPSSPLTAEDEARARAFAATYGEAMAQRRAARASGAPTNWPFAPEEALSCTGGVLRQEPEVYSMWGWRREALGALMGGSQRPGTSAREMFAAESALVEACLMRNPKSYCAWFHRKWMADRGMVDLAKEMQLVSQMLDADERNFHCWSYRQHVASLQRAIHGDKPPSPAAGSLPGSSGLIDEIEFGKRKLLQNFSNYSAWHQRGQAWVRAAAAERCCERTGLESGASVLSEDQLSAELAFVRDALFTEPDDQSGWLYYRWLLGLGGRLGALPASVHTLRAEEKMVRDLLDLEPESRHALVTLAFIEATLGEAVAERRTVGLLEKIDPLRAGAYVDWLHEMHSREP